MLGKVEPNTQVLHDYGDGSYNTQYYEFGLKNPLDQAEIESITETAWVVWFDRDRHRTIFLLRGARP